MSKQTANEISESLTGFDEIAIKQHFGGTIRDLSKEDPTQYMRSLVFIIERRGGKKDPDAYHAAQSMSLAEIGSRFGDSNADEDFDEQPRTTTP